MITKNTTWIALLGGLALSMGPALAQDSGPLLDLLVKKGIVSDQESEGFAPN